MQSEPGSPQDMSISSGGEDDDLDNAMEDVTAFPLRFYGESIDNNNPDQPSLQTTSPPNWSLSNHARYARNGLATTRVATPTIGPLSPSPAFRTAIKQHIRHRHPQELLASSDLLEVPPSIEEDEAATPPSAAEAAGSQFSMLSVSDMDVEPASHVPSIAIETPAITDPYGEMNGRDGFDYPGGLDENLCLDDRLRPTAREPMTVHKQRMRSCALSAGNSPTRQPSPFSGGSMQQSDVYGSLNPRRTLSLGFRADCEKCRLHVPGHMNHFVT